MQHKCSREIAIILTILVFGCSIEQRTLERARHEGATAGYSSIFAAGSPASGAGSPQNSGAVSSAGAASTSPSSQLGGSVGQSSTSAGRSNQPSSAGRAGEVASGGRALAEAGTSNLAVNPQSPTAGTAIVPTTAVGVAIVAGTAGSAGKSTIGASITEGGQHTAAGKPSIAGAGESGGGTGGSGGIGRSGASGATAGNAGSSNSAVNYPSCFEGAVNASCGDCLTKSCGEQYDGCHASAKCEGLLTCIADCMGTLQCVGDCQSRYADVLPLANALFDCTNAACETQCGALGEAITAYAQAHCGKMRDCAPGQLAVVFGSYESCVLGLRMHKTWVSCLSGVNANQAFYSQCAAAWAKVACGDFFGPEPDACWKSGVLSNGRACNASEQCESMFCKQEAWSCGVCTAMPADGTPCNSDWGDCGRYQWCTLNGTCESPRGLGRSCSDDYAPCRNDMMCDNGQCVAASNQIGTDCDVFAGVDCAWAQNVACSLRTNQCVPMTHAKTGEPCGQQDGSYAICIDMGTCTTGKCVARPSDHGPCDPAGDRCRWPALCGSSNTCSMPMDTPECR